MTSAQKRRGDRAEREVCALLAAELGVHARRAFGAGRGHDEGDIVGVPDTVIQVCDRRAHFYEAVREKPLEVEQQRLNAGARFAQTWLRLQGGIWRIVLTPEQGFEQLAPFTTLREGAVS